MDENRPPTSTTHHGDDTARPSKAPKIQENSRTANDCLTQIVDLFIQNQRKSDETLVHFSTESSDLLEVKEIEKLDEEIKNYSDHSTPEIDTILEEALQNSFHPREVPIMATETDFLMDFLMECNHREEAKKKLISEVLEIEKNMENSLYYEQKIQRMVKTLEDYEKASKKPISMKEKIMLAELMRSAMRKSLKLDIEEVPFGAERMRGPIGDLMREIDPIVERVTEIGYECSRLQKERNSLIQRTRVILFKIKIQLDKNQHFTASFND